MVVSSMPELLSPLSSSPVLTDAGRGEGSGAEDEEEVGKTASREG
jgi:hypothetical protein